MFVASELIIPYPFQDLGALRLTPTFPKSHLGATFD